LPRFSKHSATRRLTGSGALTHRFVNRADPRIAAIGQSRARAGLTHQALCAVSGVHPTHWFDLRRGQVRPTDATVKRLKEALHRRRQTCSRATLADFFWTVAGLFGEAYGLSPAEVFNTGPGPNVPSKCRRLAAYVLTLELCVSNAELARAIGQTRQNIHQARNIVELRRDDPAIDALIERITQRVRWRGREGQ
jgi:hypothetical protein